jgi:hypothetical protein
VTPNVTPRVAKRHIRRGSDGRAVCVAKRHIDLAPRCVAKRHTSRSASRQSPNLDQGSLTARAPAQAGDAGSSPAPVAKPDLVTMVLEIVDAQLGTAAAYAGPVVAGPDLPSNARDERESEHLAALDQARAPVGGVFKEAWDAYCPGQNTLLPQSGTSETCKPASADEMGIGARRARPFLIPNNRRCDHCGQLGTAADLLHGWDWPGRPDGIRLHSRCEPENR